MKFYIPTVEDATLAEKVYTATAEFVSAPVNERRIRKLKWCHDGEEKSCEIGNPAPSHYRTGKEPVVAIFDTGVVFLVCTASRGVLRGGPIFAEKDYRSGVTYFDAD